jgi:phosphatidylserine/phosphatidylglycerophosphate/cardiolipin synthase-like enzyme
MAAVPDAPPVYDHRWGGGLDGQSHLTVQEFYRNNNHVLRIRNQEMVASFQAKFNAMFERGSSGASPALPATASRFEVEGVQFEVYFAPEGDIVGPIVAAIEAARQSIRFLTFSFTEDRLGEAMQAAAERGVTVQGVFETTGSLTQFSELTRLFCAGQNVRQDGNPFILHYNLILVDGETVILSSFNFSSLADITDDDQLILIRDSGIAANMRGNTSGGGLRLPLQRG